MDAALFEQLVDLKDHGGKGVLAGKSYRELFTDIRHAVDLCHRDGSIKDPVSSLNRRACPCP